MALSQQQELALFRILNIPYATEVKILIDDDNLQTLCTPCHKRKTAGEASARAERVREARSSAASCPDPDAFEPEIVIRGRPIPRTKRQEDLDGLFEATDSLNARVADALGKGFRTGS